MAIKRPAIYEHNNPNLPIVDGKNVLGGLFIMSGATAQERYNIPESKLVEYQLVKDTDSKFWELTDINQHDNISGWTEFSTTNAYIGDITYYVESTGDDTNDGLTIGTAFATYYKALQSLPKVSIGTIKIYVGAGVYDYDLDKINGLITNLSYTSFEIITEKTTVATQTITQHVTDKQRFTCSVTPAEDYLGMYICTTSQLAGGQGYFYMQPIVHTDGDDFWIPKPIPNGEYIIVKLDVTFNFSSINPEYSFGFGSNRFTFFWGVNFIIPSKNLLLNPDMVNHNGFLTTCNFGTENKTESPKQVKIYNGILQRCFVRCQRYYGDYSPHGLVDSTYSIGVKRVGTSVGQTGYKTRKPIVGWMHINNFEHGYSPVEMQNSPKHIQVIDGESVGFMNLTNGFYAGTQYNGFICKEPVILNNVTNFLNVFNEDVLKGLRIDIPTIVGDTPTNMVIYSGSPSTTYQLLDEQVVDNIVLPDRKSSHILELTTTEKNLYPIPYEGQVIKDVTLNSFFRYENGLWVLSCIYVTGATTSGDTLIISRNDGVDVAAELSGATAEAVLYTNSAATPTTIGGVEDGSTFSAVTMQDMWTDMLYPTLNPRFTTFYIPGVTTSVDVGYTFTGTSRDFTWATVNPSFIQTDTVEVVDLSNSTSLASGLTNDGNETIVLDYDVQKTTRTSHTFQVRAKKENNTVFTRNYYWNWYWRRFHGGSSDPSLDEAGVSALSGQLSYLMTGDYVFPAENTYKYIAIPVPSGWINPVNSRWYQKDPSSIKDVATNLNLALAGPADGYNDVINGLPFKEMTLTNVNGYTETYRVFRSKYKLGGAITIKID